MMWYAIDWFGGVKVECQDCHHYTTEWTEPKSRARLIERFQEEKWDCSTCILEAGLLLRDNQKLKRSVEEWKESWFQLREIIGELWWHHPAIDNDERRLYYQANLQRLRAMQKQPNDVYVNDKLVGSGTSPEAANAIRRLMGIT
jgi:hypothetical protein